MRSAFLVAVTIVLIAAPFGAAEEKDCHTLVDLYEFDGPSHRNDVPTGLRTGPDFVAVSGYTEKDADGFDADAFLTVWRPGTAEMPTTSVWDGPAGGYDSFFDLHYAIEVPASPVFAAGYAANNVTNGDFSLVVFDEDANVVNEDFFDAGAGGDDCAFAVTKSGNAIFAVGYGQPNGQADVDWAVVKYDLDGHRLWNRAFAGTGGGHDVARKVAPDGQGGIVVGGESVGETGPELTGAQWDRNGNLLQCASADDPSAVRTQITGVAMLDGPTLVIGGNYYGDGDDFIRSGAYEIDGATVFGFATLTGYSSREQINLQGLTVDGSTGPFDVAVFGFEPPELTAGEKGADQEALIAAFDADGERVWHSTWDASDQGLLGVPNDFDDNGGALIAAAHTVADDEETRAALLLVDHSDVEAKDTFVFSHLLEVSGTILDTQNTFDTTVFVSYVPEPLGDDDDDDGDDDAGDPVPRMAGVANFIPSGSNDLDTAVFVLDIACLGDDDDDDVVDDDTEDDDMTDDDVTDDDMIDDDAADDDYAEPDDDNDDGGGGPCGDDDDGGGCGC